MTLASARWYEATSKPTTDPTRAPRPSRGQPMPAIELDARRSRTQPRARRPSFRVLPWLATRSRRGRCRTAPARCRRDHSARASPRRGARASPVRRSPGRGAVGRTRIGGAELAKRDLTVGGSPTSAHTPGCARPGRGRASQSSVPAGRVLMRKSGEPAICATSSRMLLCTLPDLLLDRAARFARVILGGEARVRETAGGVGVPYLCWREREVHERGCYWWSSGPTREAEACYCTSSLEAKTESASGVSQTSICRSWNF